MRRYLEEFITRDMKEKIILLSGARQVGKTTLARQLVGSHAYLNYDSSSDRRLILAEEWSRDVDLVIFDELHKLKNWKSWIKGVYDTEGIPPALLVTGSARLDTYRKGGDSLAGRFFPFRLHPLGLKEICRFLGEEPATALDNILRFGGFPEPYFKKSDTFARRWRRTHTDIVIREDLLDLERVRDIKSIEILIDLLRARVGSLTSYSSLANDLQVSVHTVKHWLQILENLYIIFPVRPYHRDISRSILKTSKYYMYDTGEVQGGDGPRLENTVACALMKEIHLVEDTTGRRGGLFFLRDKEKREVDFLVVMDGRPVLMVAVKDGDDTFSRALFRFHGFLPTAAPVQVVHKLKHPRTRGAVRMVAASEFLLNFEVSGTTGASGN